MGASLSLVPLIDYFARREFLAAGLRPHSVTFPYPYDCGDGKWGRCPANSTSSSRTCSASAAARGTTPRPTAPAPSEATQAAALAALLDSVEGLKGKRVAVAGTSYGGFVAYWLARAAGAGRVGPVVIASSDVLKTAADDREFLKRAGEGWGGVHELLLPAEPAAMRRLMQMAAYRAPPAMMTPDFVLRDFIKEVLIVWGEHDQLFPVEKAFAVQRALDGKARVEIMKETGHAPQLEDPARFNEIVLDFLLAADKHADPSINGSSI
ncbi:hypothetical protein ACQ4PT_042067 [Festuca glaucescens]